MGTKCDMILKEYIFSNKVRNLIPILFKGVLVIEIIALVADICPLNYPWYWLERIFVYKMSDVIPVVAITWGIVSIPMSFLLGRVEQDSYGIKLIDFLIASWGSGNAMFLVASFVFQLPLMLWAITYSMSITFTVVAWTQILYVCLAFYLVVSSLSHEAIKNIVKSQSKKIGKYAQEKSVELNNKLKNEKSCNQSLIIENSLEEYSNAMKRGHWILKDMIKNLDYKKIENIESLESILRDDVCHDLIGVFGQKMTYELFEVLLSVADLDTVNRISVNVFCGNIGEDAQKGILGAFFFERSLNAYKQCEVLLEKWREEVKNDEVFAQLCYWSILWEKHQELFIVNPEEKFRNEISMKRLRNMIGNNCCFKIQDANTYIERSCFNFMIVKKVSEINRIVENLFTGDTESLFGGKIIDA